MNDSASSKSVSARDHMINSQLRPNEVNDRTVISAIRAVPRENFVPKSKQSVAYVDEDLDVGNGRCLMEPMIFAKLMVAANIQKDDLVLDVGCSTGYSAAVYAQVADSVVALEEDESFSEKAEKTLTNLEIHNVAVVCGKHEDGVASQGPFDVIALEGSVHEVPETLIEQLCDKGRLVCVLVKGGVGRAHIITRNGEIIARRDLFDANTPPLSGFKSEKKFVF